VNFYNTLPPRILQFGEGNFLRAFIGDLVDQMNANSDFNAGIIVIQPIAQGLIPLIEKQQGAYTLFLNGIKEGQTVEEYKTLQTLVGCNNPYEDFQGYLNTAQLETIDFIISNTTEAGISYDAEDRFDSTPPKSFPAKLTRWLWERWNHFKGDAAAGVAILPCELINYNADSLEKIIFQYIEDWQLAPAFSHWLHSACSFHNTLVDRIVTGYPKENEAACKALTDFDDQLMVVAEPFFLWVIEGGEELQQKLPLDQTNLDVKIVDNLQSFRTRKVRILNGAHTCIVPLSIMFGNSTVAETMKNDFTSTFLQHAVLNEIAPHLEGDAAEMEQFSKAVFERFENPFVNHYLASIALNSISKFKVRVLPSILAFKEATGEYPPYLCFSFACLLRFYQGNWQGAVLPLKDDAEQIAFFENCWKADQLHKTIINILKNEILWDVDLSRESDLVDHLKMALTVIENQGVEQGFATYITSLR